VPAPSTACRLGVARIVVAHHHFAPAPDYEGGEVMPKAKRAIDAFADLGVEMVLGGHLHRAYIGNSLDLYPGADREHGIIIVQSGTTTSRRGRAREREKNTLNLIRVGEDRVRDHALHVLRRAARLRAGEPAPLPARRPPLHGGSGRRAEDGISLARPVPIPHRRAAQPRNSCASPPAAALGPDGRSRASPRDPPHRTGLVARYAAPRPARRCGWPCCAARDGGRRAGCSATARPGRWRCCRSGSTGARCIPAELLRTAIETTPTPASA
jgi:hypothetical protein